MLEALPERERQILLLRFFGGMTQTEIANRIGVSQMHVSRLLSSHPQPGYATNSWPADDHRRRAAVLEGVRQVWRWPMPCAATPLARRVLKAT